MKINRPILAITSILQAITILTQNGAPIKMVAPKITTMLVSSAKITEW
jgi:hypothetical protein